MKSTRRIFGRDPSSLGKPFLRFYLLIALVPLLSALAVALHRATRCFARSDAPRSDGDVYEVLIDDATARGV